MRILLARLACVMAFALAGGSDASAVDQNFRTDFRENAVESCIAESRNSPWSSHYDWPRLCGCAIDRWMIGKSEADLRVAKPEDPALRAASEQCAMEQASGPDLPKPTG
jgi:hypothetical protein